MRAAPPDEQNFSVCLQGELKYTSFKFTSPFLCLFLFKSVRQVLPVEFERSSTAQLREKRISALRGLFTHGRRVASAADSQQEAARNSLCSVFSVCAEFIGL